jgi:hypothetical protein
MVSFAQDSKWSDHVQADVCRSLLAILTKLSMTTTVMLRVQGHATMMATCTTIQPAGRSPAINMDVAHPTRGMRVWTGRRHSQLNRPIAVIPRRANLFEHKSIRSTNPREPALEPRSQVYSTRTFPLHASLEQLCRMRVP